MKVGRKPEKLALAWSILRRHRKVDSLGGPNPRVYFPLKSLQGPMSAPYAGKMLTKLEEAGYIKKEFLGGRTLEYIVMLKDVEELGGDVLGTNGGSEEQTARAARAHAPRVPTPALSVQAPVAARLPAQPPRPHVHVVILADYENSAIPLKAAGSEFPSEGLLKFAREKGIVLAARVFIPMTIAREERLFLRRSGWSIMECPPLKDGGGDTVDKTIEEEMRLFMLIPSVGTFIVVSRDADFQDAKRMVENRGRKCVFVYYDNSSGEMRSENGEQIDLNKRPRVIANGRNGAHQNGLENKFSGVVCGIETGMIAYDPADALHGLIGSVVAVLRQRNEELQTPRFRKHFMALCDSVWTEVSAQRGLRNNFSRDDVRDLLTAFNNSRVLQKHNEDEFTYYTFDDKCSFVKRLTQTGVL